MGSHLKTSNLLKTPVKGKEVGNALKMSGKSGSLTLFSEGVTSPLSERQSVLFFASQECWLLLSLSAPFCFHCKKSAEYFFSKVYLQIGS